MANMSYCRFHNTYIDFVDCLNAMQEGEELSMEEEAYSKRLYDAAQEYIAAYELNHE